MDILKQDLVNALAALKAKETNEEKKLLRTRQIERVQQLSGVYVTAILRTR